MPTKKPGDTKKSHERNLVKKDRFSKNALVLFVLIFAGIGAYILLRSFAAPTAPAIYLTGAPTAVLPNTTFTVQIRETSGTTGISSVEADFSYNTSLVQWISTDSTAASGGKFSSVVSSTGANGTVSLGAGPNCTTSCPLPTGDNLVATVTFKSLTASGTAPFNMLSTSNLTDANGTKINPTLSTTWNTSTIVDGTAPTVSITAPTNGSNISSSAGSVTITSNPNDANSGVKQVDFFDGATLIASDSTSPYSATWSLATAALGSHTLTAKVTDNVGLTATSTAVVVNITDGTAPSTPANFRVTGTTINTVNLGWNASTDNVGVTGYKITRNGTLITTTPLSGTTLSYSDTGLAAKTTYTYTVVAIDAAGNTSTAATISATTSTPTPGDLNADGSVNGADISIMAANWHVTQAGNVADINGDGTVDIADLAQIILHYTG